MRPSPFAITPQRPFLVALVGGSKTFTVRRLWRSRIADHGAEYGPRAIGAPPPDLVVAQIRRCSRIFPTPQKPARSIREMVALSRFCRGSRFRWWWIQ
jgi:hypothetical protein